MYDHSGKGNVELVELVKSAKYAKKMAEALYAISHEQLKEYKKEFGTSSTSTADVFEALVYTQVGALKNILVCLSKTFAKTKGKAISQNRLDELEDVLMMCFDEDFLQEEQGMGSGVMASHGQSLN